MRPEPAPLGTLSVDQFMSRHWQREPLLIRGAFPDFIAPVTPATLFDLAARDDVESRLVRRRRDRWSLDHGPFEPGSLPTARQRDWTVLVQGVDLHVDAVHALLSRFRFVPDARLDDLMISFAGDGGGVGPHLDSYDVFLIQAHGRRRWRVAPPGPTDLLADAPLRILSRFEPTLEWEVEPGDMIYLPPQWGHDGVALGECMTYSVGFRAPSRHELLRGFLADCADDPDGPDPRYGDAGRAPTRHPARLPADMSDSLASWLTGWRPSRARIDDFIGRFLTEPKPSVWFDPRARVAPLARWWPQARARGLRLDRRTRVAYRGRRIFINGESVDLAGASPAWLPALLDARELPPDALAGTSVDSPLACLCHEWFANGWIAHLR